MNTQPNFERISGAFIAASEVFVTASQEIAHIPNIPALNNGQHLLDAINGLTRSVEGLRTEVASLRTEVASLRTEVTSLRTDMNSKFENLNLRLSADAVNNAARLYNSHISSRETALHTLHDRYNEPVEEFPRDSATLMRLSGNTLLALFNAYELPTEGSLETKKRRFREFVGLVVDA